jgi:Flagellar hook-length control protein FliK
MTPVILPNGVEPVVAAKLVVSGRDHALRLLPELDPGDIVSARVEAILPDGSYKVMVGGQPMSMNLPSYITPGDVLELSYVAREPRLTFALNDVVPAASAEAAAPQLSATGRLVAATMLQAGELATPVAVSASAPLLTAPPANGARLSGALAQTLASSGLFYESHQAQWVAGERDLAQIIQEPQARLTLGGSARDAGTAASTPAAIGPSATALTHGSVQTIDPRTVTLVQQQLAALDGARVVLQIEIWPQQWMQWKIDEHQPGSGREPHLPPSWNTQLRLVLPQLGELRAALSLAGEGVRISLESDSAASAALLQDNSASLRTALAAAGVPAAAITIARHGQA